MKKVFWITYVNSIYNCVMADTINVVLMKEFTLEAEYVRTVSTCQSRSFAVRCFEYFKFHHSKNHVTAPDDA